jgi:hypothetical protein
MTGGSSAASGSAATSGSGASFSTTTSSGDAGEASTDAGGELTGTEDVPLPVSPYAIVGGHGRCKCCFADGYTRCRR